MPGGAVGTPEPAGLADVLWRVAPVAAVVRRVGATSLCLMTRGKSAIPSDMIGSERMGELLRSLSSDYDFVLLDGPTVLDSADAEAVARWADDVLVIVHAEGARGADVQEACRRIAATGASLRGLVLVGVTRTYLERHRREPARPGRALGLPRG